MKIDLTKEIIRNLDGILTRPLMTNNFPFNKNYIKRKNLVKAYLTFHIFQNRLLSSFSHYKISSDYDGIMIGYLVKTFRKKNGIAGDYSNIFLKKYLNKKRIKTAEILIPALKEVMLFKYWSKAKPLAKSNSFILSYPKLRQNFKINKPELQNKILQKIESIKRLNKADIQSQYLENLNLAEKNIEEYIDFISSKEFIRFLFGIGLGLDSFFKTVKPKFIIVNSISGLRDRLAVFVAQKNNIKTLFIPHGIGNTYIPRGDTLSTDIEVSRTYNPDKKRENRHQKEIWNLGPLIFGYLVKARESNIPSQRKNKFTIMYASQPHEKDGRISKGEHFSFLTDVFTKFKEIEKNIDVDWIIKSHPRDDIKMYKRALKKANLEAKFIKKPSPICINKLEELKLDIVIAGFSTFGIEMILLKKMLLGLIPYSIKEKFPPASFYKEYGVPIYTEHNLDDFKGLILEILRNKEKKKKLIDKEQKLLKESGIWINKGSLESFLEFLNNLINKEKITNNSYQ